MNCDLVFEILTRGPFPSGEPTDASVELHLSRCHDCRQLAEALRPAVSLFHETLSEDEGADNLPGYYGALCSAEETALPATIVAAAPWFRRMTQQPAASPARRNWHSALPELGQLACGVALGAALCVAFAVLLVKAPTPQSDLAVASREVAAPRVMASAASKAEPGLALAALQLPLPCLGRDLADTALPVVLEKAAVASHAADSLACCTECHNAGNAARPRVSAIALLQRGACVACHQWQ